MTVETLFVALGIQKWSVFVPDANTIELHTKPTPENEDLLDFAAICTLQKDGTVYPYPVIFNAMPGKSEIVAIFRD
jgi:hypothetical protein